MERFTNGTVLIERRIRSTGAVQDIGHLLGRETAIALEIIVQRLLICRCCCSRCYSRRPILGETLNISLCGSGKQLLVTFCDATLEAAARLNRFWQCQSCRRFCGRNGNTSTCQGCLLFTFSV